MTSWLWPCFGRKTLTDMRNRVKQQRGSGSMKICGIGSRLSRTAWLVMLLVLNLPVLWMALLGFRVLFSAIVVRYRNNADNNNRQQTPPPSSTSKNDFDLVQKARQVLERRWKSNTCRCDGECPTGMLCRPNQNTSITTNAVGTCRPVLPLKNQHSAATETFSSCLKACQAELEMDEHFYYNTKPHILQSFASDDVVSNRGCILEFERRPENPADWKSLHAQDDRQGDGLSSYHRWEPPPSQRTWDQTRFRHVLRVEPVPIYYKDNNNMKWRAYCWAPCQTDSDCNNINTNAGGKEEQEDEMLLPFVCKQGACQRNRPYWEKNNQNDDEVGDRLVIVTAANTDYFRGLENLVASARYWAPHHKVVIYNLGGLQLFEDEIKTWTNVETIHWIDNDHGGIPHSYPKHVRRDLLNYAWKPLILLFTALKYRRILWLDAGSTLTGPIGPVNRILERDGIFLVKGQDAHMKSRSHPDTYTWLCRKQLHQQQHWGNHHKQWCSKESLVTGPHFSGNTQGYLFPSRFVKDILIPNADCALHPECIAPPEANLDNHRFDQTSLSILAYIRGGVPHHTEYLSASPWDVQPDLHVPSYRFIWTARQALVSIYLDGPSSLR